MAVWRLLWLKQDLVASYNDDNDGNDADDSDDDDDFVASYNDDNDGNDADDNDDDDLVASYNTILLLWFVPLDHLLGKYT